MKHAANPNKFTPPALIYLLLFVTAFVPRVWALDAYVAPDEGKWIYRSAHFLQALLSGDLAQMTSVAATPEVEVLAPAVTTMWTGAAGLTAKYWWSGAEGGLTRYLEAIPQRTEKIPLDFYPWTRFPTVLLTALTIPLFYFFLTQLIDRRVALLAALLLALDPFFIGLSRVIHHDALAAIFIALSLLSLLVHHRFASGGLVDKEQPPGDTAARRSSPAGEGAGSEPLRNSFFFRKRLLILSGLMGGLALLTKPTAAYLVVFVWLFLLVAAVKQPPGARLRNFAVNGLVWGGVAGLTFVAAWPAMWVAPVETMTALMDRATNAVSDNNNYSLLPRPGDPLPELGFLFYPVNWLFKATLPAMAGLAAFVVAWRNGWFKAAGGSQSRSATDVKNDALSRRVSSGQALFESDDSLIENGVNFDQIRFTAMWLALFSLLFLALLIPADTRDIRYFLPAVPALYGLAALGLFILSKPDLRDRKRANDAVWERTEAPSLELSNESNPQKSVHERLSAAAHSPPGRRPDAGEPHSPTGRGSGVNKNPERRSAVDGQPSHSLTARLRRYRLIAAIAVGVQLTLAAIYAPYFVSYWNPVAGGPWLAPHLVKIGSGEGIDQVGRYLSQKPDAPALTVATSFWESFVPFFLGRYTKAHYDEEADYILIYRRQIQNTNPFPEYWTYFSARVPEYTATLTGLEYAWLYPGPQLRVAREADFGDGLALHGYRLARPAAQPGQVAALTLVWAGAAPEQAAGEVTIRLIDEEDQVWVETTGPLLAPEGPSAVEGHYPLEIPATMPRGDYRLWVSVEPADEASDSLSGIDVGTIPVRRLEKPPVQIELAANFSDLLNLAGANITPTTISPEQPLDLTYVWQAPHPLPTSYTTFTHIVDDAGNLWGQVDRVPGDGQWPTTSWQSNEWIVDAFQLRLDPNAPPGDYALLIGVYDSHTLERLPVNGEEPGQTVVYVTTIRVF